MKIKTKKEKISDRIGCALLILIFGGFFVGYFYFQYKLNDDPLITHAIVSRLYYSKGDNIEYKFKYKNKLHTSTSKNYYYLGPKIKIGDTIQIKFSKSNPWVCKPVKDKNGYLKIKRLKVNP